MEEGNRQKQEGTDGKDRLHVFGESTSIHGIRNLSKKNTLLRRMIWTMLLFASFGVMAGLVYTSVINFLSYETNTKFKETYKGPLEFPKVTICNTNMFRYSGIQKDFVTSHEVYTYGYKYLKALFPEVGFSSEKIEFNQNQRFGVEFPGGGNMREFVERNGHQIETMLKVCNFNGKGCTYKDFDYTITNYGVCYTFVPPTGNLIHDAGTRYGLSLILDVENYEYVSVPRENVGFRISISGKSSIPNMDSGIDVSTGLQTQIGVRKSTVLSLPPPHGSCIKEGALMYLEKPYTQNKCLIECESNRIAENCSCRMFYSPGDYSVKFCSPKQIIECYQETFANFISMRKTLCDCPEACTRENYQTSLSSSVFPSVTLLELSTESESLIAGALIDNVYKHSRYTLYDEVAYIISFSEDLEDIVIRFFHKLDSDISFDRWSIINSCESLMKHHIYDLVFPIKINMSQSLVENIYYEKINPLHYESTEFNSSNYFTTYNITRTYIGKFHYESVFTEELIRCATIHNLKYDNETIHNEGFEYLFNNIFEQQYKFHRNVFSKQFDVLLYENSRKDLTTDFIRQNYARVNIFYESMKVQESTDQPNYHAFTLVCNFGGTLGLFFGASVVAIVETFDYWLVQGFKKNKDASQVKIQ